MNPTDLLSELSIRTWCRKRDFAYMVFDVERVIVNPVRLVETERNRAQLLAQQRYQRARSFTSSVSAPRSSGADNSEGSNMQIAPTWPAELGRSSNRKLASKPLSCFNELPPKTCAIRLPSRPAGDRVHVVSSQCSMSAEKSSGFSS